MRRKITVLIWSVLCAASYTATATTLFEPGNRLVNNENTLYEYDADGQLVSQFSIPENAAGEVARDIAVLDDGRLAVFNGTFSPELAVYDGTQWVSHSMAGWSTVNNGTYGGIAAKGDEVFVTDTDTAGAEASGVVVFNLADQTSERYLDASDYIDVTLGRDGYLYALRNSYGDLDVVDPATRSIVNTLDLGHTSGSRAATADTDGNIYMASWSGYVAKYDPAGVLLNTLSIGESLQDIDLGSDGEIIVGAWYGGAYVTDKDLMTFTQVTTGSSGHFVALVPSEETVAPPVLSGSHYHKGRWLVTTLNWTTEAPAVDVYLNGSLIETISDSDTATYKRNKKMYQAYRVCNAGTQSCSEEYVATWK